MKKMLRRWHRDYRGILGLEAAIILIAFVVIASILAFTVLSAGFLATDQAKGTILDGLEKTASTLEVKGSVIARESGVTLNTVASVEFVVASALPGRVVNVNTTNTVVSYWDTSQKANDANWTATMLYDADADGVLDGGDQMLMTVDLSTLVTLLGTNIDFVIEVKPPQGGVMVLARTTPPSIDTVTDLR